MPPNRRRRALLAVKRLFEALIAVRCARPDKKPFFLAEKKNPRSVNSPPGPVSFPPSSLPLHSPGKMASALRVRKRFVTGVAPGLQNQWTVERSFVGSTPIRFRQSFSRRAIRHKTVFGLPWCTKGGRKRPFFMFSFPKNEQEILGR